MKHLSIKFLLLICLTINFSCPIINTASKPGKRSPFQLQQRNASKNRLRLAQQKQKDEKSQEEEKNQTEQVAQVVEQKPKEAAPIAAPAPQPIQTTQTAPTPQPDIPSAEEIEMSRQYRAALKAAQSRPQQPQQPLSLWRMAYLQIAPTAINLLFKAIQEGTGATIGNLIKGYAKRRQNSVTIEELAQAKAQAAFEMQFPGFLELSPQKKLETQKIANLDVPSLPPASKMVNQAFYQGMLSAAGSVISAVFISFIASGLQKLMPMQMQAGQEE